VIHGYDFGRFGTVRRVVKNADFYPATCFLITPEAQKLWEKYQGQTSMFIPGTPAFAFAQKHRVLVATDKFAREKLDELTERYGKMIGLR